MGFYLPGKRGTVRGPFRCNAPDACLKLYNGMKGLGTDEAAVIDVVTSHNFKQRQQISKKYQQVYKRNLLKELDGELSFAFGKFIAALMTEPEELIVQALYRCVIPQTLGGKLVKRLSAIFQGGLGRTEYCLLSLLCPRTNKQVAQIKKAFVSKHALDLEEKIAQGGNELHQDLCMLLLDMLSEEREEEGEVDPDQVEDDVDSLLVGGAEAEGAFQTLIQEKSWGHLRSVFELFCEEEGTPIDKWVEDAESFSMELKEAYKAIYLLVTNEPAFYADRLRGAIAGAGTDDETLIRVVVLRSEIDLLDIMDVYEAKFGISLADDVSGDTSGDYKEAMLRIIRVPPPEPEKDEKRGVVRRAGRDRAKKVKAEEVVVAEEEVTSVEEKPRMRVKRVVVPDAEVAPVEEKPRKGRVRAAVVPEEQVAPVEEKPRRRGSVRGAVVLKQPPKDPVEVEPLRKVEWERKERRNSILRAANLQKEEDERVRLEEEAAKAEQETDVEDEAPVVSKVAKKVEAAKRVVKEKKTPSFAEDDDREEEDEADDKESIVDDEEKDKDDMEENLGNDDDDEELIVIVPPDDDDPRSTPHSKATTPEPETGKELTVVGATDAAGGSTSPVISREL